MAAIPHEVVYIGERCSIPTPALSLGNGSMSEKGLEFKGGSLHDGFAGFGTSGGSKCVSCFAKQLVPQSTGRRGDHDSSTIFAISCVPCRIQNPSDPQNTPQNTSRILSRNQIRKKYENYTETPDFRIFFIIFSYFGFGRGFEMYFGVYFGDQRGFVFCTGRRRSQHYLGMPTKIITEFSSCILDNCPDGKVFVVCDMYL